MQPLYEDQYGLLRQVSRQSFGPALQSLYTSQEALEPKPLSQWMLLKNGYLGIKHRVQAAKTLETGSSAFECKPKSTALAARSL